MKDGYIRVAAGSFDTSIANVTNNSKNIIKLIDQAYQNQTKVLVLPELCLTGYTCEDLFNQERLLNEDKNGYIPQKRTKEYYESRPCLKIVEVAAKITDDMLKGAYND